MATDPIPGGTLDPRFSTCRLCGDAVPPGALECPVCGADRPIRPDEASTLKGWKKRRFRLLQVGRIAVVVAVVVGLTVLMIQAALTPAPIAANPLTETSVLTVVPGGFEVLSGSVTGADYIQGNYSVVDPPGAVLTLSVYNLSEFAHFAAGQPSKPLQVQPAGANERIVFAALYTDTYYLVWQNHYPSDSGLDLTFYVTTAYETNVQLG